MIFRFRGKYYRLRDDSVLIPICQGLAFAAVIALIGIINSWELGLL